MSFVDEREAGSVYVKTVLLATANPDCRAAFVSMKWHLSAILPRVWRALPRWRHKSIGVGLGIERNIGGRFLEPFFPQQTVQLAVAQVVGEMNEKAAGRGGVEPLPEPA